jgi:hypothetical protein
VPVGSDIWCLASKLGWKGETVGGGIWDWIVVTCRGENLAILGPRLSGKSTLHAYLGHAANGAPEQTLAPEQTTWIRNTEVGLRIRSGLDVPGGEADYADWSGQFKKSSKVFYLFDAYKLRTDEEYRDRVNRDGREIRGWGPDGKRVMMLGTHADTDPLAKELSAAKYLDQFAGLEVVANFRMRAKVQRFAVGSLATSNSGSALVKRALS